MPKMETMTDIETLTDSRHFTSGDRDLWPINDLGLQEPHLLPRRQKYVILPPDLSRPSHPHTYIVLILVGWKEHP